MRVTTASQPSRTVNKSGSSATLRQELTLDQLQEHDVLLFNCPDDAYGSRSRCLHQYIASRCRLQRAGRRTRYRGDAQLATRQLGLLT